MRRSERRRGLHAAKWMVVALVVSVVVPSPSSGAAAPITASSSTDLLDLAELLPNPTSLHPDIARQVQVDLSGMGSIPVELSAARQRELDAVALGDRNRSRHAHLLVVQRELRLDLALAASEVNAAAAELDRVEADLADFALGTFVGSTALDLESFTTETGPSPIPTLASDTEDVLVGAQRAASASLVAAEAEHRRLTTELDSTALELSQVASAIVEADSEQLAAAADVARLEPAFESALLTAPVVGAGFPVIVLDAYYRAALRTGEDKPWCEVRWDQLAGIGKVESGHGTFGGNVVGADGRTSGEILGPVLDGTRFASIPDTDGGRYDLDPVWDRAVGPMQFIPGSWVRYGGDGNGDGEVDPHNMYDAAMAAANHLCGTTGGLADDANYQRALLGYNRSVPYGVMVMDLAAQYREIVGLEPTPTSVADPGQGPAIAALRGSSLD